MRIRAAIANIALLTLAVFSARASDVKSLNIDVHLTHNGDAHITEHWNIDVSDDITEWYLVESNLGKIEIKNFGVSDKDGPFVRESHWDLDRSRSQKARRCGIVDKGGNNYELCWGVGSSGPHDYYVNYTMTNFVRQLNDSCAFNHMFVARDLSYIDHVRVEFFADSAMTRENTRMWTFGHRNGLINLNDTTGTVVEEVWGFTKQSAVIIMLAFGPEMFKPDNRVDEDFADMKQRALDGSDYLNDDNHDEGPDWLESHLVKWFGESAGETIYSILLIIFMGFIFLIFLSMMSPSCFGSLLYFIAIIPLIWILKRLWYVVSLKPLRIYLKKKKIVGDPGWFRDVPANGNLLDAAKMKNAFSYALSQEKYDNLIAAYIMRLIYQGAITIVTKPNPKTGAPEENFFFTNWDKKVIIPGTNNLRKNDDAILGDLFDIMEEAAGNDATLQPKELKKWAKSHTSKVKKWYDKIDGSFSIKRADPQQVKEVFGLEKFLKEFTLVKERHIVEVALWDEYLVYATLFGIADQVAADFRKVCPEYFQLSKIGSAVMLNISNHDFVNSMSTAMAWSAVTADSRSSVSSFSSSMGSVGSSWGGGGGSSWGGGGGFSGGGSGGGGR